MRVGSWCSTSSCGIRQLRAAWRAASSAPELSTSNSAWRSALQVAGPAAMKALSAGSAASLRALSAGWPRLWMADSAARSSTWSPIATAPRQASALPLRRTTP